jgi:hypothetical protein
VVIRDNAGKGQVRIESDRLRGAMRHIAYGSAVARTGKGKPPPPSSILPVLELNTVI